MEVVRTYIRNREPWKLDQVGTQKKPDDVTIVSAQRIPDTVSG